MTDIYSKSKRSEIMSHIAGKNTKPEQIVGKYLFSRGLRYRKNVRTLPGTPDLVVGKYKVVVFVHGCFWHGHANCKLFRLPKTNQEFWLRKIEDNKSRDHRVQEALRLRGYKVLIVWQCQLQPQVRDDNLMSLYDRIVG